MGDPSLAWKDVSTLPTDRHFRVLTVLWLLVAIYAAARFLQIFPGHIPMAAVVALHVLPALAFALVHGTIMYRLRGAIAFIVLFLVIGNILENIGVATAFPFGHYYFTDQMGPKLFRVPVFLGLAYVGIAYVSWLLANVILGNATSRISGARIFLVPTLASVIMTSWDLSQDAVWSTILHLWIWTRGGTYFGVPLSNFLGWLLVVYIVYQCFAVFLWRTQTGCQNFSLSYWRTAIAFYGVCAAGNLLLLIPRPGMVVVPDPSGVLWKVSNIILASAAISVLVMGTFAMWAWLNLRNACAPDAVATR